MWVVCFLCLIFYWYTHVFYWYTHDSHNHRSFLRVWIKIINLKWLSHFFKRYTTIILKGKMKFYVWYVDPVGIWNVTLLGTTVQIMKKTNKNMPKHPKNKLLELKFVFYLLLLRNIRNRIRKNTPIIRKK